MPYSPELVARIRRLHFHEHYTIFGVSKVVDLHRDTVKRLLYGDDSPEKTEQRLRVTDQYVHVIEQHLKQYPSIRISALLRILNDRGYSGSYSSLARRVRPMRKKVKQTFKPMQVFQGEQGQVDWAHFGSLQVGKGQRKVYLFVMVLSWSRTIYARFTFDQKTDSFLRHHEDAFVYFGGTPRHLLYDNLKSAVIERYRDKVKFNDQLIEFSGYYGFQPKACKPYSGNEKGRVERSIRYIRDNFFSGYTISSLDQANIDLSSWLKNVANERQWADNKERHVNDVLKEEQQYLLKLPEKPVRPRYSASLRSNKCSLVRFDLNDYSIPWRFTREMITLEADDFKVFFYSAGQKIAEHKRLWGRGERITQDEHWQEKVRNGLHNSDELLQKFPVLDEFYRILVDRGESIRSFKKQFQEIYRRSGEAVFRKALRIGKNREMYHPSQIARLADGLENSENNKFRSLELSARKGVSDLEITSHNLETYDHL